MSEVIALKMEHIQAVFMDVQRFMQANADLDDLLHFLDAEGPEFRSVGYEAAGMELALRDWQDGPNLDTWKVFLDRSRAAHGYHVPIGLGWAFAKKEINPAPYLGFLDPEMRAMVFDGIGYFCGLFRGRRTIRSQELPVYLPEPDRPGFDQGLGRRLWYNCKGELGDLIEIVRLFPEYRQADLWRGIGIASCYVGSCTEAEISDLFVASGKHKDYLCTGINLALTSRKASGSLGCV